MNLGHPISKTGGYQTEPKETKLESLGFPVLSILFIQRVPKIFAQRYMIGGKNWFNDVFTSDYESVASKEGYYELMRFWLLGTWMANYLDVEFCFINLVLENRETDIEPIFRKHLKEKPNRQFHRFTWESAYRYVSEQPPVKDTEIMLEYFRDRTIGYDRKGHLLKAFSL